MTTVPAQKLRIFQEKIKFIRPNRISNQAGSCGLQVKKIPPKPTALLYLILLVLRL